MPTSGFENFSKSILRTVESLRSIEDRGSAEPTEHRINAFYRALGLPAISLYEEGEAGKESFSLLLDPDNNGNFFSKQEFGESEGMPEKLRARQATSSIDMIAVPRPEAKAVTEQEKQAKEQAEKIVGFLDGLDKDKYKIGRAMNDRPAGALFPMVVDDTIRIFPRRRRVLPAFSEARGAEFEGGFSNRPLIETIISLKLINESVESGNPVRDIIHQQFRSVYQKLITTLSEKEEDAILFLRKTVLELGKIRRNYSGYINPAGRNAPSQNQKVVRNAQGRGDLDKRKRQNELYLKEKQAGLSIFEFDDTFGVTGKTSETQNVMGPLLASDLIGIVHNLDEARLPLEEVNQEIKKSELLLQQAQENIEFVFGEFRGLSSVDILVVIEALFDTHLSDLLSLLNKKSIENFRNAHPTFDWRVQKKASEVVLEIQEKVEAAFGRIQNMARLWDSEGANNSEV